MQKLRRGDRIHHDHAREEDAVRSGAAADAIINGVEKMQELYKMQGWEKTDVHFSLTDVERNLGVYDWEEGE